MTREQLGDAVRRLHEDAYDIRVRRNISVRTAAALPLTVGKSMRDAAEALDEAAQAFDDAARDLLAEYGEDLPDGVL